MHPDFQTIMSQALSCIHSLHFAKTKTATGNIMPSQFEDPLLVPCLNNLETSGLQQSPQTAALNGVNHNSPAIVTYTSSTTHL
jgi:hypothetical protein